MGELVSALDALTSDDLYAMSAGDLLERTAELVRARNRLDAELARTVRRAELAQAPEHDGLRTMASWLRGHARLSPAAAAQVVRNGRALESLPAVAAGCAEGVITAEQVTVMAQVNRPEHVAAAAEQGVDLAEVGVVLAQTAATRQHAHLGQVVHHYLSRLDPDGVEPDPTEGRALSISRHSDGTRTIRGELDAVGGEKFEAMLESFVQADRPRGDLRTRAQQLGDALVQAADVALASGRLPVLRTVKPHVAVIVDIDDLADPAVGPGAARTGFGAVISAARARWLACDGNLSRVVMGPDGQLLDYGRSRRIVPPPLRRAVEIRDRHCVFAGCEAPTHWCDVHHVREWLLDDGPTSEENSALLCERHSHLVSTTASRWGDNPTADGAPTAPTARRSSCPGRSWQCSEPCRRRPRAGRGTARRSLASAACAAGAASRVDGDPRTACTSTRRTAPRSTGGRSRPSAPRLTSRGCRTTSRASRSG